MELSAKKPTLRESLNAALKVLETYEQNKMLHSEPFNIKDPNAFMTMEILNRAIVLIWNAASEQEFDKVMARNDLNSNEKFNTYARHSSVPKSLPGFFSVSYDEETDAPHLTFRPPINDRLRPYLNVSVISKNVDTIFTKINLGWDISCSEDGALFFTKTLDTGTAHLIQSGLEEKTLPIGDVAEITRYRDDNITFVKDLRARKAELMTSQPVITNESATFKPRFSILMSDANDPELEEYLNWRNAEQERIHNNNYSQGNPSRPLSELEQLTLQLDQTSLPVVTSALTPQAVEQVPATGITYIAIPVTPPVISQMQAWGAELPGIGTGVSLMKRIEQSRVTKNEGRIL